MRKILIVLLADKWSHENMGRASHALLYAKQSLEAGLEVKLIFDGGGTEWAAEMTKQSSHFHKLYKELIEAGVVFSLCESCAKAFKVEEELKAMEDLINEEDQGHPDIGKHLASGWDVITL
ncbi:DsrE family protein [Candidatus Daviesbacteria bacterium]|nr:DsrE family protein [Candidatus Daviesbacteria bacterium]